MKLTKIKTLTKGLATVPSTDMYERTLRDTLEAQKNSAKRPFTRYKPSMWRVLAASRAGALIAACLAISLSTACFVLYRRTADLKHELARAQAQQDVTVTEPDNSATINLYLQEHQDVVARHVSLSPAAPQAVQMQINQDDIMYYEFFDDEPQYMHPGIIVRGRPSQREIGSPEAPVISNGHTMTLAEARETAGFALRMPARLHPGYALDQIRRIDGRDALQLLYTDGVNSVSLFEQSLDGRRELSRQDLREYAIYRNAEQAAGTILAWRDDALSYVLIGNTEMSQLMDMAQSISARR